MVGAALERGANLTEAAMAGGFSSSSHLSVAFRAMFGLSPSRLIKVGARFKIDGELHRNA